jgi:hypothetical protein
MNINNILGEDKRFNSKDEKKMIKSVRVFFTPKLFIYHKERNIKKVSFTTNGIWFRFI